MPYYIVESSERDLTIGGVTLTGVPTTGYSRDLWHFVVNTKENPMDWPASPTGRSSTSPRRAPDGVEDWWVVRRGAKARSSNGLRSNRNPLGAPPPGFPMFDWP